MNKERSDLLPILKVTTPSGRSISPVSHEIHFFPEYESNDDPGHYNICPCLSFVSCIVL
jgi:hypothetical protein